MHLNRDGQPCPGSTRAAEALASVEFEVQLHDFGYSVPIQCIEAPPMEHAGSGKNAQLPLYWCSYLAEVRAQEEAPDGMLHALAHLHQILQDALGWSLLGSDIAGSNGTKEIPVVLTQCSDQTHHNVARTAYPTSTGTT